MTPISSAERNGIPSNFNISTENGASQTTPTISTRNHANFNSSIQLKNKIAKRNIFEKLLEFLSYGNLMTRNRINPYTNIRGSKEETGSPTIAVTRKKKILEIQNDKINIQSEN